MKLFIFFIISTFFIMTGYSQDPSKYNDYAIYLKTNKDVHKQNIFKNIVDRTFELDLNLEYFYKELNYQCMSAVIVSKLYLIDESNVSGKDNGIFMSVYRGALNEGEVQIERVASYKELSTFDKQYDWDIVLKSYTLSAGIVRGRIAMRKDFKKLKR